jgi:hypothetical protein
MIYAECHAAEPHYGKQNEPRPDKPLEIPGKERHEEGDRNGSVIDPTLPQAELAGRIAKILEDPCAGDRGES